MKLIALITISYCIVCVSLHACPTDMSSVGIVMNSGEYCAFHKLESFGENGVNFIKEAYPVPGQTVSPDSMITEDGDVLGKARRVPMISLVHWSFNYDPDASPSFSPQPVFAFNNDTLIIHDYWALTDQPEFTCSISYSPDTLHITYEPTPGIVKDWMPTVETVLKIRVGGGLQSIVCHFNTVSHARAPYSGNIGFRDATADYYASVPVPPLAIYKYRAHSFPFAMICLQYERRARLYRGICPRITVTFDSVAVPEGTTFATVLSDELTWLAAQGICGPSANTKAFLASMKSVEGGWCHWSRQDSCILLNQWFEIETGAVNVWRTQSVRGGCGLGTDIVFPPKELAVSAAATPNMAKAHSAAQNMVVYIHGTTLNISSSSVFDMVTVYDFLGRKMITRDISIPLKNASVTMRKNGYGTGNYIAIIRLSNRQVGCRRFIY